MRLFLRISFWAFGIIFVIVSSLGLYLVAFYFNFFGTLETSGNNINSIYPENLLTEKIQSQLSYSSNNKQILFGDTHVHSTYSSDAFLWSLPLNNGEGPHPVSDACDYARFCSALDFWVISDHAEAATSTKWMEAKKAVRQCNAVHEKSKTPDLITFLGFEWTQIDADKENHYGHKNVMFLETAEEYLPEMPIGSGGVATDGMRSPDNLPVVRGNMLSMALFDFKNRNRYADFISFVEHIIDTENCEQNKSYDIKSPCYFSAITPKDLFLSLDKIKSDSIVIPHGNTWGFYTPSESSWDKQLSQDQNDSSRQISFEVMSGHGNSEEYRPWTASYSKDNMQFCPEPSENYLPSCWQAGEIIKMRCLENNVSIAICDQRASLARQMYVEGNLSGHFAVKGVTPEEWLDSGQCKDCFIPSFNYRPKGSAQYALALRKDINGIENRFKFGFIASSDNHRSRPGTGYKPIDRMVTTEANGPAIKFIEERLTPQELPSDIPREVNLDELQIPDPFSLWEPVRQSSFFTTGGLAAVHVDRRSREGIWDSFKKRETYATSGPRILLWFNLIETSKALPMGTEIVKKENPVFEVKAFGSFKQKDGCPDYELGSISAQKIKTLCKNECYNPSEVRNKITRIEVIKITPQDSNDEDIDKLIKDPWKIISCPQKGEGCRVRFSDEQYSANGRDSVYYVRAIEEPSMRINAGNLRCDFDELGNCNKVNLCYGNYKTSRNDNCTMMSEERAWSSPIYLNFN